MPIRPLPPLLVNQIAAGEVIERPASVVKELIENGIDAEARRIDVAIENGGKDLIRVTDDGRGIRFEELPLALAPHATSKIESVADLEAIATLGFRGEAIASMVAVSRVALLSRPPDQEQASRIEAEGDEIAEPRPAPGPVGTTVTVRNLFFNTPARRKFLRTDQTETARVAETIDGLALSHPAIGFSLQVGRRRSLELRPGQSPRQRVLAVIGSELEDELLEVRAEERGIRLWGLIGRPAIARGTAKASRFFVNGRLIGDRSISHAIREAYRGLIDPARFPLAVLFIEMDPTQVDVNVHPTKMQVRFRNQAMVHAMVLSSLRSILREADLTPELDVKWPPRVEFSSGLATRAAGGGSATGVIEPSTRQFVEYFRRLDPTQKGFVYSEVKQALASETPQLLDEPDRDRPAGAADPDQRGDAPLAFRQVTDVLQVHSSYLVTPDEQGLVIIDQHALHERVIFEKLIESVNKGNLEAQRLLMPAIVEIDPAQLEILEQLGPLLVRIGIEAEPLGPTSIAIQAFTSLLFERNVEPAAFMTELLDRAQSEGLSDESEAALHEVLDMMACKAAVKAGDRLSPLELQELLKARAAVERSSNCPHGRPTSLRLTIADLDRQFGRR